MSIIIKKRPKYNKKKLIQRITVLAVVYFLSFFLLYVFFGEKHIDSTKEEKNIESGTIYENEGDKLLAEGKYPETIQYFEKVLDKNPEDYIAMNRIGQAYYKLKRIEKAKFYLFKSKEIAPKYADTYIKIAIIYIDKGDFLAAENMIDIIPTYKKEDFIAKGNILLTLAKYEPSLEEKIIHYTRALTYFKKYDDNLYKTTVDKLIAMYFELAKYYTDKGDKENAMSVYRNVTKYRDDCNVHNELAIRYMNLSEKAMIKHLQKAVDLAETQEEKRMTKQNIIAVKQYFEKNSDVQNMILMDSFMMMLNESTILIDEKTSPFSITEDEFNYIKDKDEIFPEVTFQVLNKSDETITTLYAKVAVYLVPTKIISSSDTQIIFRDVPLKPQGKSAPNMIRLNNALKADKTQSYTISLSLSTNGKDWYLYRLYKQKENKE